MRISSRYARQYTIFIRSSELGDQVLKQSNGRALGSLEKDPQVREKDAKSGVGVWEVDREVYVNDGRSMTAIC